MSSADEHPVRIARNARTWDLKDLAEHCGRSMSLLSMIEHGYVPRPATRHRIADALETTVELLWPDEQTPPQEAAA